MPAPDPAVTPTTTPTPRARLDTAARAVREAQTPADYNTARAARDAALSEIVTQHAAWRSDPSTGARANLARADLAGADLADADLAGANLAGAYLAGADLADADLADADLADADLAGANLAGAYLAGANLAGANLAGADLADADLADADLAGANLAGANLARADLADANLAGANLAGAYRARAYRARADLAGAYPPEPYQRQEPTAEVRAERARRFRERNPDVPVVERLDSRILDAITSGGGTLDMGSWHVCETTHCRGGWAVHLAGAPGYALERIHGPARAGRMIYRASTGRSPHFFAPTDRALEDIRRCAEQERSETGGAS